MKLLTLKFLDFLLNILAITAVLFYFKRSEGHSGRKVQILSAGGR